ncbi:MAG: MFS transporter [Rhizobiaceae bacterium]
MRPAARPYSRAVVSAVGIAQILAFGSTFYLPAVLAKPIADDTGWSFTWVVSGLSLAMLVSGLVSPLVGRLIHKFGGRPVLASSAVLLAAGLGIMAMAPTLLVYLLGWLIVGLGMATGLYDAAFSSLGRLYGENARGAITWVTLYGGFASTVCWPLSAFLVESFGWRATCLAYAAAYLLISLPAYLFFVPRVVPTHAATHAVSGDNMRPTSTYTLTFFVVAAILTLAAMIASMLSVHLLTLLQSRGIDLATAVAFGTIVGPAQVIGRLGELAVGKNYHPIWAMTAAVALMAGGIALLPGELSLTALALLFYGAGNGIMTIAKGTLPLVLFDSRDYALIMGRLATLPLLIQALAPSIGALLLDGGGSALMLAVLLAAAVANLGLTWVLYRRR